MKQILLMIAVVMLVGCGESKEEAEACYHCKESIKVGALVCRYCGKDPSGANTKAAADAAEAAPEGLEPPSDLNASPEYRCHLARVLTRRGLEQASR